MTTATKPRKRAVKKRKVTKVSQETEVDFGPVVVGKTSDVDRHPLNRKPKSSDVDAVASSINEVGQLEAALVRRIPYGGLQILSGETRWLACKKNETATFEYRIGLNISDSLALKIVAEANAKRSDLDPIQRAELLQQLTLPVDEGGGGYTQEQAGEIMAGDDKKMSRSSVSNSIRLLKLPDKVRGEISTGYLPETFARELIGLLEQESTIIEKAVLGFCKKPAGDNFSRGEFVRRVRSEVRRNTRPMRFEKKPYEYYLKNNPCGEDAYFKPDKEQSKQLGIITVGGDRRATNVKLWDKLQKEAAKVILQKRSGKGSAAKSDKKPSASELKAQQKKRDDQYKRRLADWEQLWKRWWLPSAIDEEDSWRLIINQAAVDSHHLRSAIVCFAESRKMQVEEDIWQDLAILQQCLMSTELSQGIAKQILWPDSRENLRYLSRDAVDSLCNAHEFEPEIAWDELMNDVEKETTQQLVVDFYQMHNKESLTKLAKEVGLGECEDVVAAKSKGDLVKAFSENHATVPKCLVSKRK